MLWCHKFLNDHSGFYISFLVCYLAIKVRFFIKLMHLQCASTIMTAMRVLLAIWRQTSASQQQQLRLLVCSHIKLILVPLFDYEPFFLIKLRIAVCFGQSHCPPGTTCDMKTNLCSPTTQASCTLWYHSISSILWRDKCDPF